MTGIREQAFAVDGVDTVGRGSPHVDDSEMNQALGALRAKTTGRGNGFS